ncbi:hypothetical protein EDD22DRAFT_951408 [Suillus occidentalis]|nr:hypothetical protein EDD22DRAFT_951408 [Suillus occidentalis]
MAPPSSSSSGPSISAPLLLAFPSASSSAPTQHMISTPSTSSFPASLGVVTPTPQPQPLLAEQVFSLLQHPWLSSLAENHPSPSVPGIGFFYATFSSFEISSSFELSPPHHLCLLSTSHAPVALLPAASGLRTRVHGLPPSDPIMQLDPNDLIDHDLIVYILKEGWQTYFPINSLSADLTCTMLHYVKAPTEFNIASKLSISYSNFCEAARMLPVLIGQHLNSPFRTEIVEAFCKHYDCVLNSHDFQHNFAAYMWYDIMIHQHLVNNLLDFNPTVFQPHIFSHCLELVKSESELSITSRIASLEALVMRGNSFCASLSSLKPSTSLPTADRPITKAPAKVIGICWFCAGKHSPRNCFASCSTASKGVLNAPALSHTNVLSAVMSWQVTMPSRTLPHPDLLPIITPLLWDKWAELLDAAGVLDSFLDVPLGL